MTRFVFCLLFSALAMFGQTLTLTGPATARQGETISVNLTLANPPASLAATQWSITLPAGYTATATAGAASTAALKTLYCNSLSTTCLTVGINANLYAAGIVATYRVAVPATAAPGEITIPLSGLVGATLAGDSAPLTAGVAYTFRVILPCDVNGDGRVDLQDVLVIVLEAMGGQGSHDLNGDGKVDIRDVQIVARAAF